MEKQYDSLQDIMFKSVYLLSEYGLKVEFQFLPLLEQLDVTIPVQKGLTKRYMIKINDVDGLRTVVQELTDIELELEKKKQDENDFLG